ncbi:MAG TPA: DUF3048 domain-containing protein [Candidatus Dormibacteraeota bacterium]
MIRALNSLKPIRLGPLGLVRPDLLAAGAIALAVLIAGGAVALLLTASPPPPRASLSAADLTSVRLAEPVAVKFNRAVDLSKTKVQITPAIQLLAVKKKSELIVQPVPHWDPHQRYVLRLGDVPDAKHAAVLKGFKANFTTQPLVGVVNFTVDGHEAGGAVTSDLSPLITAVFVGPMKTSSVQFLLNGQPLAATSIAWDAKSTVASITLPAKLLPYRNATLQVPATGFDGHNNPMTGPAQLSLSPLGLEPANTSSGIGPGFKTIAPVMVVIENAPGSLPSHGLQGADMVFEYLSEYGITRMTALYFNQMSPLQRSVRSCRMMNAYLDFAFRGYHLCSGTSAGTYSWLMGKHGNPVAPGAINDVDTHGYFFRCGGDAPHNLCTSNAAMRIRQNWPLGGQTYLVDPPHPDSGLGTPNPAPSIPQHCVNYNYDPGSQTYLRFDHGSPYIDAQTGQQVHVKNVVVMSVGEHYAGWVEDENGGAGSVWYEMLGSGPAVVYMDGKAVQAQWHMADGLNLGNNYWLNDQAPYFTDDSTGNVIELDTGLTWVHVVGKQALNAGC